MDERITFSPGELLYKFNEAVWTKGTRGAVTVRGVYSMQDFEIGDSKYIDRLVDEVNEARLNVVVTAAIRKAVRDGNVVNATGYLDRYLDNRDGSIRLQLRVVALDVLEQSSVLTAKEVELSAIRHRKMTDGYKPVDTLLSEKLEKGLPRIALIYPTSSIVHLDFLREIGDCAGRYVFEEIRTPFTIARTLSDILARADVQGYDAVCLVRGGGSDFGALEAPAVLETVAGMKTPVIAAVGHEDDTLFINEVVDKYFSTPTSLGAYLRRLVEDSDRKQYKVTTLQEALDENTARYARLKKWFAVILVLLMLMAVTGFLLLTGKITLPILK